MISSTHSPSSFLTPTPTRPPPTDASQRRLSSNAARRLSAQRSQQILSVNASSSSLNSKSSGKKQFQPSLGRGVPLKPAMEASFRYMQQHYERGTLSCPFPSKFTHVYKSDVVVSFLASLILYLKDFCREREGPSQFKVSPNRKDSSTIQNDRNDRESPTTTLAGHDTPVNVVIGVETSPSPPSFISGPVKFDSEESHNTATATTATATASNTTATATASNTTTNINNITASASARLHLGSGSPEIANINNTHSPPPANASATNNFCDETVIANGGNPNNISNTAILTLDSIQVEALRNEQKQNEENLKRSVLLLARSYSRLVLYCSNFESTIEDLRFWECLVHYVKVVVRLTFGVLGNEQNLGPWWDVVEGEVERMFRGGFKRNVSKQENTLLLASKEEAGTNGEVNERSGIADKNLSASPTNAKAINFLAQDDKIPPKKKIQSRFQAVSDRVNTNLRASEMLRMYIESPRRQKLTKTPKKEKFELKRNLGLSPFVKFVVRPDKIKSKSSAADKSAFMSPRNATRSASVVSPINFAGWKRKSFLFS